MVRFRSAPWSAPSSAPLQQRFLPSRCSWCVGGGADHLRLPDPRTRRDPHTEPHIASGCARLTLVSDNPVELNAAQQDVLARLRRPAGEHPTFDAGLGGRLREELESALADVAEGIDPSKLLFVNKHTLTGVLGCEASFLHDERQGFAWDPPKARGSVAHKAIELGINWRASP